MAAKSKRLPDMHLRAAQHREELLEEARGLRRQNP
jgi:hypothetical protein